MTKFKVITIKKRGGGTRKQRVQVLSSGKFKFVKNKTTTTKTRSSTKRRSPTKRKVIKQKRRSSNVVKRRSAPKKRSALSKIPLVNNALIRKVATGIGLATIGVTAISIIAPSLAANPIVKPALAFLGGGIPGVIGQVVVSGGLGGLGGSSNGGGSNAGFA